jgi:hypothetical protein
VRVNRICEEPFSDGDVAGVGDLEIFLLTAESADLHVGVRLDA